MSTERRKGAATPMSDRLTYAQVADRIEAALGERPALSALRAGATRQRAGTSRGAALTAGMPSPTPGDPGSPSLFEAAAIDSWLANHPRRSWPRLLEELAAAAPEQRSAAVAAARAAGISWQRIVDAINAADGTTWTRQWAQQKFGRRSR